MQEIITVSVIPVLNLDQKIWQMQQCVFCSLWSMPHLTLHYLPDFLLQYFQTKTNVNHCILLSVHCKYIHISSTRMICVVALLEDTHGHTHTPPLAVHSVSCHQHVIFISFICNQGWGGTNKEGRYTRNTQIKNEGLSRTMYNHLPENKCREYLDSKQNRLTDHSSSLC